MFQVIDSYNAGAVVFETVDLALGFRFRDSANAGADFRKPHMPRYLLGRA